MDSKLMADLAAAQLSAYNSRDLEAFCKCYHDEVVVTNLLSGTVSCRGKLAFKELYRKLFESCPKLRGELKSRMVFEDTVIDEEWVTGISKFPNGLHVAAIYAFRDGLIDRVWFPRN